MSTPSLPTGYEVSKHVRAGRSDCHLTVGFDKERSHIPRFLVQLHYQVRAGPVKWRAIARMDHNETSVTGHDVYHEGLHVDVARRESKTLHLHFSHGVLPASRGMVIRRCVEYFQQETDYFVDVYEERRSPGRPPSWTDGGESAPTFIHLKQIEQSMSQGSSAEETLSLEELTEVLADAEDTTPEEIKRGADDIRIDPPEAATVVDD